MAERSNKIDDLIDDLIYLRKDTGFVSSRIYEADSFIDVIGGKNQIYESIKIRFEAAILSLPNKQDGEALLAAYGLLAGYEGATVKERRDKYGKKINRKYDTLANKESAAMKELAIRLLNAYYSGAPLPAELPIPHGGFLMDYLLVETTIQDRKFIAHQHDRGVISLVNGAKGFEYHSSGRTRIIPIEGLTVETRYVKNGSIHRFLFPKPLIRGQTHKFSFQEILEEPEELEEKVEDYAGQSFETPTLNFKQKVIFKGEKPAVIWSYDKLSRIERPGEQSVENILTVHDDESVQKDFIQLYGGLHSGIAWRWK